jgi:hypothetical protein
MQLVPLHCVGPQIALQLALAFGLQLIAFWLLVRGTGRFMPLRIEKEERGAEAPASAAEGVTLEEKTGGGGL